MENKYRLLIIEDEQDMAELIEQIVGKWGFEGFICNDFDDVLNEFKKVDPDIVLMDINIPAFDGFYWCKEIREISGVPIVFISSRDSSMDIVMAMNNGGDDYITKPFDSKVLIAKLKAIIRRTYEYQSPETQVIECNNLILNLNNLTAHYRDQSLELTKNEFRILKTLMENKDEVVSRGELMKELWDDDMYVNENTLTVNINRLRKRLQEIGVANFIETKRGMGYIIR